ncbi:MAG: hypothetical protein KIT80_23605 [Chitinophagaceae bacterium]|nr:hypothetical protein [Nitrosomonas sp.]MCW5929927.1 hypothetical protein [Chitinophagaceae bacterium]
MKNENAEKPAMPSTVESKDGVYIYLGLTKREYFAAMAMQGMLTNPANSSFSKEFLIQSAVEAADVLLEKLEK